MFKNSVNIGSHKIKTYSYAAIVVGTGAAGYNAADRLYDLGVKDVAIVTEHVNAGTSRNTGSDKQTYYKLTLSGGDPDSVGEMAKTLFSGQAVDGDIALCEAALSAQCFLRLCELGVEFPRNRYGEYIGYKTDHDPRRRATSVGPYTSRMMTEALEHSVASKPIAIHDKMQAVKILTENGKTVGLICLNLDAKGEDDRFVAFCSSNIVFATGGPAGIYYDSVFPFGHHGSSGIAFEAGAKAKNLTEWQFGLASVRPRWNVSGTYMQVLPKFVSANPDGSDEKEFLSDFFKDKGDMLTKVFLKGYQWPFDVRKVDGGSSIIDLLCYVETILKGRRVFLDFRQNPGNVEIDFDSLDSEAKAYLERAGALFGTPIARLEHMNAPAVSFYKDKGVDLHTEPLEIALCAQHNNGGIGIDCWWHTDIEGFFAVGEAAASHGVYRPGGSALNAGQVGSTRAAQWISQNRADTSPDAKAFENALNTELAELLALCAAARSGEDNTAALTDAASKRMSRAGGAIRDYEGILKAKTEVKAELKALGEAAQANSTSAIARLFILRDILLSQLVYLSAMADYIEKGGKSRGSALYSDKNGRKPYAELPDIFSLTLDDGTRGNLIQELVLKDGDCTVDWREARPIPSEDDFFENVWRDYRLNRNIF